MKHLAATGVVYEADVDKYLSTTFSKALTNPIYRDAYPVRFVYEKLLSLSKSMILTIPCGPLA